ncbi:MAG: hypothetical protein ACE1ZE_02985, partial [Candidatus Binatia bacterium]
IIGVEIDPSVFQLLELTQAHLNLFVYILHLDILRDLKLPLKSEIPKIKASMTRNTTTVANWRTFYW